MADNSHAPSGGTEMRSRMGFSPSKFSPNGMGRELRLVRSPTGQMEVRRLRGPKPDDPELGPPDTPVPDSDQGPDGRNFLATMADLISQGAGGSGANRSKQDHLKRGIADARAWWQNRRTMVTAAILFFLFCVLVSMFSHRGPQKKRQKARNEPENSTISTSSEDTGDTTTSTTITSIMVNPFTVVIEDLSRAMCPVFLFLGCSGCCKGGGGPKPEASATESVWMLVQDIDDLILKPKGKGVKPKVPYNITAPNRQTVFRSDARTPSDSSLVLQGFFEGTPARLRDSADYEAITLIVQRLEEVLIESARRKRGSSDEDDDDDDVLPTIFAPTSSGSDRGSDVGTGEDLLLWSEEEKIDLSRSTAEMALLLLKKFLLFSHFFNAFKFSSPHMEKKLQRWWVAMDVFQVQEQIVRAFPSIAHVEYPKSFLGTSLGEENDASITDLVLEQKQYLSGLSPSRLRSVKDEARTKMDYFTSDGLSRPTDISEASTSRSEQSSAAMAYSLALQDKRSQMRKAFVRALLAEVIETFREPSFSPLFPGDQVIVIKSPKEADWEKKIQQHDGPLTQCGCAGMQLPSISKLPLGFVPDGSRGEDVEEHSEHSVAVVSFSCIVPGQDDDTTPGGLADKFLNNRTSMSSTFAFNTLCGRRILEVTGGYEVLNVLGNFAALQSLSIAPGAQVELRYARSPEEQSTEHNDISKDTGDSAASCRALDLDQGGLQTLAAKNRDRLLRQEHDHPQGPGVFVFVGRVWLPFLLFYVMEPVLLSIGANSCVLNDNRQLVTGLRKFESVGYGVLHEVAQTGDIETVFSQTLQEGLVHQVRLKGFTTEAFYERSLQQGPPHGHLFRHGGINKATEKEHYQHPVFEPERLREKLSEHVKETFLDQMERRTRSVSRVLKGIPEADNFFRTLSLIARSKQFHTLQLALGQPQSADKFPQVLAYSNFHLSTFYWSYGLQKIFSPEQQRQEHHEEWIREWSTKFYGDGRHVLSIHSDIEGEGLRFGMCKAFDTKATWIKYLKERLRHQRAISGEGGSDGGGEK
ncbi:unnamed protein product [Amoebophrya sp. A25]|nr:unnamed protein product [Amoebophrya sp. A25]|eukprot:GSA25T00027328001.1